MTGKDQNVYEAIKEVRQKLASATDNLKTLRGRGWDEYMQAVLPAVISLYERETPARIIVEHAERICFAVRRALEIYVAGASPNEPTKPLGKPAEKQEELPC